MLSAIIVGSEGSSTRFLREVCAEFRDVCIYKTLDFGAREYDLTSALNSYSPDVVFLDVSDPGSHKFETVLANLENLLLVHSETAVVAFADRRDERLEVTLEGRLLGPMLVPPFNADELEVAVVSALERKRRRGGRCRVASFLPAKGGSGSTTVALNVAGCLANRLERKTLLIEADVHSGTLSLLLNLQPQQFLSNAMDSPAALTDNGWAKLVCRNHGFDILPASGAPRPARSSRWDYYRLLKFARERYDFVLVDLSDLIDEATEAVISESDHCYLVSTPDVPTLKMVGRRLWDLEVRSVRHNHLRVLVNRHREDDPPASELERVAGQSIAAVLAEDVRSVKDATRHQRLVAQNAKLGAGLLSLAADLAEVKAPRESGSALRRLVGYAFGQ
ncbi:MAG: CpaE family protein [Bryobacteraceae bacterium]